MEQYAKKLHKKIQAIILGACSTKNKKIIQKFGHCLETICQQKSSLQQKNLSAKFCQS